MTPERWARLKTILVEALQRDSLSARVALVQEQCADDTTMLLEAESLLQEAESLLQGAPDKLEGCADVARTTLRRDDDDARLGQRLGAYLIELQLGRGGMGTVYLARRADGQFEKEVAIKILKRGTDTDELLHRFRAERQILAGLDHPNIARILDAATTEDGLPYFIMDYVAGVPVTHFVKQEHLSIEQSLQLFLKICSAVETAHRQLIVHRDLKPRNILVKADGEPKLLDFGIAKLLAADVNGLEQTAPSAQRFTPACASPEQASGGPITVATDVYALGALLYEILSGEKPHQFSSTPPSQEELTRVLRDEDPVPPSSVVSEPEKRKLLAGDLDMIVLHALHKEPARRYISVEAFATDIQRHLSGQKISFESRASRNRATQLFFGKGTNRLRFVLATAGLLLLLAWLWGLRPLTAPTSSTALLTQNARPAPEKSIAVLPFQNLSAQAENAFFADGMQDEILTDLAKVSDLKVISRTSMEQYRGKPMPSLRDIGQQLGVAHVLEGSVQHAGNRIRVTAKLIDARTDAQLWGETYDRDLADVFLIQSEIAKTIVRQLQARLSAREKADIEAPATRDIAAYDLYLRAKDIVNSHLDAQDPAASLLQAVRLLTEATTRDPGFVLAYSYAARAHSLLYALGLDPSATRIRQAETAIRTALELEPNSAEAHLAKADYNFRCFLDLAAAHDEIEIARPGLPNNTPFYVLAGNIYRRQNRWEEAEVSYAKAVELDPKNANAANYLADTQILMRKFPEAIESYDRARQLGVDPTILSIRSAIAEFAASGETSPLRAALAEAPADFDVAGGETPLRIMIALLDHDYEGASRILAASPRTDFQDVDFSFYYPRSWYEAVIARAEGNEEKARAGFAMARSILLERLKFMPNARTRAVLAQTYAGLGDKATALRMGTQAVEIMPVTRDAYEGPLVLQGLAQVYTWTGDKDHAFELLARLLSVPGYLTYGYLKTDPAWDPLRSDPRFAQMLASLAPSAARH